MSDSKTPPHRRDPRFACDVLEPVNLYLAFVRKLVDAERSRDKAKQDLYAALADAKWHSLDDARRTSARELLRITYGDRFQ